MNISGAVKKEYEQKSLKEILKSPVIALQGISQKHADMLREAFKVETVEDMADMIFVNNAQAIRTLANYEEKDTE